MGGEQCSEETVCGRSAHKQKERPPEDDGGTAWSGYIQQIRHLGSSEAQVQPPKSITGRVLEEVMKARGRRRKRCGK